MFTKNAVVTEPHVSALGAAIQGAFVVGLLDPACVGARAVL